MAGFLGVIGNRNMMGMAALGAAALAIPLAAALATPVDPTQPAAVEEAAPAVDAALTAEQVAEGRQLFNDWSCGACHVLGDANGHGHIGPSLDGSTTIDRDFVITRVSNGQGQMPGFGGLLTADQIDLLASYIMQAKQ